MANNYLVIDGVDVSVIIENGITWYDFVLNHKPYSVPYYEDAVMMIKAGKEEIVA